MVHRILVRIRIPFVLDISPLTSKYPLRFAGYLFSIVLDFWPARKTAGNQFDPALIEADKNNMLHFHKDGTPGAPADFIGTNTTNVNSVESFNQREMRQV